MAKKEKFGKFVLLEEVEASGLGSEYRAAKLGATGLEKIVSVVRLNPALASQGDAAKNLMEYVKFAAQLQNPNILKIYGIGKVDQAYYISYEFLEGKSLKAIFHRCRQEGFPFSVDHALLIASKICSALEYAHGRKTEAGGRYYHGLLNPGNVLVSYEGEVRVRGFGFWPSKVRDGGVRAEDDALYLAPEQLAGGNGDSRSDIFAVGALLYETLTGQPLFQGGRSDDVAGKIAQGRLQSPTTDDDSIPKPIADILQKSLAVDPGARYGEMQEMRKGIDTLLFSGDFTPTTFNLAFFMHSLFREDIDRESKALKEEKEGSYLEYLGDDKPAAAPAAAPAPVAAPRSTAATAPALDPAPRHEPAERTVVMNQPAPAPVPERAPAPAPPPPVEVAARDAGAGLTFHKEEPKSKAPLFIGVAAVLLLLGGGVFFMTRKSAPTPEQAPTTAPTTLSPAAQEAMRKVQELEAKLQALEDAKKAEEAKAADEARKKLEAEAKRKGQQVDAAAVAAAEEEARKKVAADQERKLQEERKRLEDERKAEETRLAEEKKRAEEAAKVAANTPPATSAAAPPATAPAGTTAPAATAPDAGTPPATAAGAPPAALKPGTLVNLNDVGVIAPLAERTPPLVYPPIALRQRKEGTVELSVLVDEKGNVTDAKVVSEAGGKAGLNEAAVENVKKRRYRPATKDGVAVKVWIPVKVRFELPK